jgi:hypothetical protein
MRSFKALTLTAVLATIGVSCAQPTATAPSRTSNGSFSVAAKPTTPPPGLAKLFSSYFSPPPPPTPCTSCTNSLTIYGKTIKASHIDTIAGGYPGLIVDGTPVSQVQRLETGTAVMDRAGNLFFGLGYAYQLYFVPKAPGRYFGRDMQADTVYHIFRGTKDYGDNVPSSDCHIPLTSGLSVDAEGNVYLSTSWCCVLMVAAKDGQAFGHFVTEGNIYVVAGVHLGGPYNGDNIPGPNANLDFGWGGLALDSQGNVFIGDTGHARVRMVSRNGGNLYDQSTQAGYIYTIAGNGTLNAPDMGNGVPALSTAVVPSSMAFDSRNNLYLAAGGSIRVVARDTDTVFGKSIARNNIDTIVGVGVRNFRGDGNPADKAWLDAFGVSVDPYDNLAIGEGNNVRFVPNTSGVHFGQTMEANNIYKVLGNGWATEAGDGDRATSASIDGTHGFGIAFTPAGDLLVGDSAGHSVRMIPACR